MSKVTIPEVELTISQAASLMARKASAAMTPEQRSARARKAYQGTQRARRIAQEKMAEQSSVQAESSDLEAK